jgi:hypothetical protein
MALSSRSIEARVGVLLIPRTAVREAPRNPNQVTRSELAQESTIFVECGDPHTLRFGHVFIEGSFIGSDGEREEIYSYTPKTERELAVEGIKLIDGPAKTATTTPTRRERVTELLVAEGIWDTPSLSSPVARTSRSTRQPR